jgi:hypothetical protein
VPSTTLAHRRSHRAAHRGAAPASRRGEGAGALALYVALSLVLIGRAALTGTGPGSGPGAGTLGIGPDVQIFLWGLRWWPHALGQGLDPLRSSVVWPPYGGAVLWSSTVPLLSVLATPLTYALGSSLTWNLLVVLAPALAAWSAWLLCAELGATPAPALFGGALFGFGSFVLCEDIAHLQLSACLLLPLAGWLMVRGVRGRISAGGLAARGAAIVVAEFLLSPELLVTLAMMMVIGFALALGLRVQAREALLGTAAALAGGAVAGALLVSPLVIEMLTHVPRSSSAAVQWPVDLLNLVVPTARDAVGGAALSGISSRFPGNLAEQTGYLGLPLLLVIVIWGWRERHRAAARWLILLLAIAALLALGSALTVDGTRTIWLPWAALSRLPLLRDVLPVRMMVFVWLGAAVITALWLSDTRIAAPARALAALLVAVSLVPASWPFQAEPAAARSATVHAALRDQRVLSLPFFDVGDRGLLVQEQDRFRFSLTDSWLQLRPRDWAPNLPGTALTDSALARLRGPAAARFVAELRAAHITRLLLWEEPRGLLAALGLPHTRIAGVVIVRVS